MVGHFFQPDKRQQFCGFGLAFPALALQARCVEQPVEQPGAGLAVATENDVVAGGKVGKQADILEGPRHSQRCHLVRLAGGDILIIKEDLAAAGRQNPADHIKKSRLA